MRCRTLVPVKIRNPLWNESAAAAARQSGAAYVEPSTLDVDAGYELSGPDCWIHCCPGDLNAPPIAEPLDDECREAVRVWMQDRRPRALEEIKNALQSLHAIKDPEHRKRLQAMGVAYGLLPGAPEEGATPPKPPKPTKPSNTAATAEPA